MNRLVRLLLLFAFVNSTLSQSQKKWEHEDVCGNPEMESDRTERRTGVVIKIIDGDTIQFKEHKVTGMPPRVGYPPTGKIWTVGIAGVGVSYGNDSARSYLKRTTLNKK